MSTAASSSQNLYQILTVTPDATPNDLKYAFRRLSQIFHPDKHVQPAAKQAATDQFTRVKEAYEILSDTKLRRVYDEFGLEAARAAASPAMELTPYCDLAERFRTEGASAAASTPRDAYFTVVNSFEPQLDATGLVVALQEGEPISAPPVCAQVAMSTMATAYLSQKNTLAMRYSLSRQKTHFRPAGVGDIALTLRRQLDPYMHAEASAYVPLDARGQLNYGLKAFRSLSSHMTGSYEATFNVAKRDVTSALTFSRSFDERCTASSSWAFGAAPGYAFTWRRSAYDEFVAEDAEEEKETGVQADGTRLERFWEAIGNFVAPMGWRWTARLDVMDASVALVVRRPIGAQAPLWKKCTPTGPGGPNIKMRFQMGAMGWEVEAGGGCKYMIADTAWGTSVAMGTMGVVWKLRVSRAGHRLTLPVVLVSSSTDAKTATVAAICTSVLVSAVEIAIVAPWRLREKKREREEAKVRRSDILEQARTEAMAARELMKETVERRRRQEESVVIDERQGGGLLIERAVYGNAEAAKEVQFSDASVEGREIETELTEVGGCVQSLVESSRLQIVCATKSTLLGFWDPSALGDKEEVVLKIWYRFKGDRHVCVIADDEAIELPMSLHRVQQW